MCADITLHSACMLQYPHILDSVSMQNSWDLDGAVVLFPLLLFMPALCIVQLRIVRVVVFGGIWWYCVPFH